MDTNFLTVHGFCPICEKSRSFHSKYDWLRDHLLCQGCGSIPRERALMHITATLYPQWRNLRIHESSPVNRGASKKLAAEARQYTPTQFSKKLALGAYHPLKRWRNEDLETQTFADESFDLVVTQDVFEHLFNPDAAFNEIARTLRPGGAHIFSVPIVNGRDQPSTVRAVRHPDGNIEHYAKPEYHGNPIDQSGSLVTIDWGYDIVDRIKASSGLDTEIYLLDALHLGIRAELLEILVTRKN